jgi:hypothetical protein
MRFAEPRTENPDIAALDERRRGSDEPRITQLSKAREIAHKRYAEEGPVDICWDAEAGSYKVLRSSLRGNRNVIETVR